MNTQMVPKYTFSQVFALTITLTWNVSAVAHAEPARSIARAQQPIVKENAEDQDLLAFLEEIKGRSNELAHGLRDIYTDLAESHVRATASEADSLAQLATSLEDMEGKLRTWFAEEQARGDLDVDFPNILRSVALARSNAKVAASVARQMVAIPNEVESLADGAGLNAIAEVTTHYIHKELS